MQEEDGEYEHQDRPDQPILHRRQQQHPPGRENLWQLVIAYAGYRSSTATSRFARLRSFRFM